jgi:hypothetical protein
VSWPPELPVIRVRIARPTDRLDDVVEFYKDGVGLVELGRFEGHSGYDGIMLGLPGSDYHLEFTSHADGSACPAPSVDNLLVLYLESEQAAEIVAGRLSDLGYPDVEPENPYWDGRSIPTAGVSSSTGDSPRRRGSARPNLGEAERRPSSRHRTVHADPT